LATTHIPNLKIMLKIEQPDGVSPKNIDDLKSQETKNRETINVWKTMCRYVHIKVGR
jgi:hypothetical protein